MSSSIPRDIHYDPIPDDASVIDNGPFDQFEHERKEEPELFIHLDGPRAVAMRNVAGSHPVSLFTNDKMETDVVVHEASDELVKTIVEGIEWSTTRMCRPGFEMCIGKPFHERMVFIVQPTPGQLSVTRGRFLQIVNKHEITLIHLDFWLGSINGNRFPILRGDGYAKPSAEFDDGTFVSKPANPINDLGGPRLEISYQIVSLKVNTDDPLTDRRWQICPATIHNSINLDTGRCDWLIVTAPGSTIIPGLVNNMNTARLTPFAASLVKHTAIVNAVTTDWTYHISDLEVRMFVSAGPMFDGTANPQDGPPIATRAHLDALLLESKHVKVARAYMITTMGILDMIADEFDSVMTAHHGSDMVTEEDQEALTAFEATVQTIREGLVHQVGRADAILRHADRVVDEMKESLGLTTSRQQTLTEPSVFPSVSEEKRFISTSTWVAPGKTAGSVVKPNAVKKFGRIAKYMPNVRTFFAGSTLLFVPGSAIWMLLGFPLSVADSLSYTTTNHTVGMKALEVYVNISFPLLLFNLIVAAAIQGWTSRQARRSWLATHGLQK